MQNQKKPDAAIAENAADYDELPYLTGAMNSTQPARLAAVAHLFGLTPKPVATARVLEIGCSLGGNVIPLAVRFPDAEFLGIDISPVQIDAARKRANDLGIKNCSFQCVSLTELGKTIGRFDYIICHGVYSWVPPHVQAAIFTVVAERLKPEGVAQVSFNVLPGWRAWQPFRDAALAMLPDKMPIGQKVTAALDLLNFIVAANGDDNYGYNSALKELSQRLKMHHAYYIGHEHLEDANNPTTFKDFVTKADAAGLAYLGDCNISTMTPRNMKPQVMQEVMRRTGGNLIAMEQMLDILTSRTFRNALLIKKDAASQVKRDLDLSRFDTLHFAAARDAEFKPTLNAAIVQLGAGLQAQIESPAGAQALKKVFDARPGTVSLATLLEGQLQAMEIRRIFAEMLLANALTPYSTPIPAASNLPEKPKAFWLAQQDAKAGAAYTANLSHNRFELTPLSAFLLARMDGKNTKTELVTELAAELVAGKLNFSADLQKKINAQNSSSEAKAFATEVIEALVGRALIEQPV